MAQEVDEVGILTLEGVVFVTGNRLRVTVDALGVVQLRVLLTVKGTSFASLCPGSL